MATDNDTAQTRLDILSDAYDAQMADSEPPAETAAPEPVETRTEEPEAGQEAPAEPAKARDPSTGKFTKGATPKPSTRTGSKPAQATAISPGQKASGAQAGVAPPDQPAAPQLKAPQSWKPAARETWASLPPAAQAEVLRREKEVAQALNEAAPLRQRDAAWNQVISPHLQMIQAQGGNPLQVVGNYLQTGAILHAGAPGAKAELVANIIRNFGIPIDALAAALDGQPVPQGQAPQQSQPRPQDFRDPRLDAMLAQREQELATQSQSSVEEFLSTAEFGEDEALRHTMADILEAVARRKSTISLEDAYNAAIRALPEHRAVLEQREAAEQAKAKLASTQRTRAAASSVRGQPAASGTAQPKSRLDVLSERYDELMGG